MSYGSKVMCTLMMLLLQASPLRAASHHPQAFLDTIAGSKEEGARIVSHFCATCHAPNPMIALGAPRMNEVKDWRPRMTSGLNGLFTNTAEGFGAMPPRGGCFECTDKQLMLAILAMLPKDLHPKDALILQK